MIRAFEYCADYEGEVPGANPKNCGNYILHDLNMAKYEAKLFADILNDNPGFEYPVEERIQTEHGQTFYDS